MDLAMEVPQTVTLKPTCTGASVFAIAFDGGVAVAADTKVSYGSSARYVGVSRLFRVNSRALIAFGGDHADFQFLQNMIERKQCEFKYECADPDAEMSAKQLHAWLSWIMYYRRTKINPLWNTLIVAGVQGAAGEAFLAVVNMRGVAYSNNYIATGIGCFIMQQTLENEFRARLADGKAQMSEQEAKELMQKCIEIGYYADTYGHNEFEVATVRADGCTVDKPIVATTTWDIADCVYGYE